jgi:N-acetylmuramic acid 6-phosphate (MurNAc-6-P) etherase
MSFVATQVQHVLRSPHDSIVVLSGCGTSGRLAFFTARSFNAAMVARGLPPCFRYICAGGDSALFVSREAPEDNWQAGVDRLQQVCFTLFFFSWKDKKKTEKKNKKKNRI